MPSSEAWANLPEHLRDRAPFYHLVPKEPTANAAWRKELWQRCTREPEFRQIILSICRRDILFWLNSFAFLYEPRAREGSGFGSVRILPFNTWSFQDRAILEIQEAIGKRPIGIGKSREVGGTWMVIAVFAGLYLFDPDTALMLTSRNETEVDKPEDPDTLFAKLDFLIEHLPSWMQERRKNRIALHRKNYDNGSVIDGRATTTDLARGGRRLAVLIDEAQALSPANSDAVAASVTGVTESPIWLGTAGDPAGAFYRTMTSDDVEMTRIQLTWEDHPRKGAGLYTSRRGELEILDKKFIFPANYPFILDGRVRSPWYDREARKPGMTDKAMAREHGFDFLGGQDSFFDRKELDRLTALYCRPADRHLEVWQFLDREKTAKHFAERLFGAHLLIWSKSLEGKEHEQRLPRDRSYVLGVDVASGTGRTNSVLSLWDCSTRQKVAEFAWNRIMPHELGTLANSVGRWACDERGVPAYAVWELNGPGRQFATTLLELGYSAFYTRQNLESLSHKVSDVPGFSPTVRNIRDMMESYKAALFDERIINHSRPAMQECRQFIYDGDKRVRHSSAVNSQDAMDLGENHGDRVVADALAWIGMRRLYVPAVREEREEIPESCLLARHRAAEAELVEAALPW